MLVSVDVHGVNRLALAAAAHARIPCVGTGGSSLAAAAAEGVRLCGNSGGRDAGLRGPGVAAGAGALITLFLSSRVYSPAALWLSPGSATQRVIVSYGIITCD